MIEQNGTTIAESALTAGQLREALAGVPDDQRIVLSSDAEGNSHSPLASVAPAMYWPDSPWSGEVYPTPEEIDAPDSPYDAEEDGAPDGAERVLVFSPVN